jgi:hypothetical protein
MQEDERTSTVALRVTEGDEKGPIVWGITIYPITGHPGTGWILDYALLVSERNENEMYSSRIL